MENKRKPTRTISGVTPIAVMLPPRKCPHGVCIYCPSFNAPQSYTPMSPAVLRASALEYNPFKQVRSRIESLKLMGHPTEKIELIIMGGTFLSYPEKFQREFIKNCFDAINEKKSKNLDEAKKINETAKNRCVALCIETRPDFCSSRHIKKMLEFGATRVELGVQAIDDEIYKKINRGHSVKDVINATKRLKEAGFKVGYHIMPGLPGSNLKEDIEMFKEIFNNENFRPDQVKIYPCQVLEGSKLKEYYYSKKFIPYNKQQIKELLINMLKITPRYCRVMRIMREIPERYLIAGIKDTSIRKEIEEEIRKNGIKIKEIRFREVGFSIRDNKRVDCKIKLKKTTYKASNGLEVFLEFINRDDFLFGLLRLRLDSLATIREVHVYSPEVRIGNVDNQSFQHKGIGKKLIKKAEEIAKKEGYKKIRVISGVGVREYYKKLGYSLDKKGIYMEKNLLSDRILNQNLYKL